MSEVESLVFANTSSMIYLARNVVCLIDTTKALSATAYESFLDPNSFFKNDDRLSGILPSKHESAADATSAAL